MSKSSALLLPPSLNIFDLSLNIQSPIDPANPAASSGGMQHTPYNSSQSVSSSDDSPSPRTPPTSEFAVSSANPSPSPNIQPLQLPASASATAVDSGLCAAAAHDRFSPDSELDRAPQTGHPEVLVNMDQHHLPQQGGTQPNQNVGKGGCWTCRIRRKKCDEQRTDNACQTCIRLRIDCLGWGPKRPNWMRDKQAVEAYKAGIKEKLIKAGMVRGQPRLSQSNASRSATLPSSSSTAPRSSIQFPPGHPHSNPRSMSTPAAFGGLGAMGPIGPMGALGVMGSSMPGVGMSYDYSPQQQFAQQQQQPHSARYGPYPSPRMMQSYSPHASQPSSHTPHASAVMGAEFDYFGSNDQFDQGLQQQRRASFGVQPSHRQSAQRMLENRRHSQQYHVQHSREFDQGTSSPSLAGDSSHGNSPYVSSHIPLGGHFSDSSSNQSQNASLLDFSSGSYSMGPMSGMAGGMSNVSPGMSSLTVPGMGLTNTITGASGLSNSPLMLSGDESILFSGGGGYAPPPSRSPSTASASTNTTAGTSSSSSVHGAGYNDPLSDPSLVEPHVRYYFDSVMPMQYAFASERARGALQNLFAHDPNGALVNASCALAAKHNKTIRVARLLDPPDVDPQQSTAQQFYDRAFWQLQNATARVTAMGGGTETSVKYTVSEALASLHLAGYFLLQGGTGDWPMHLNMARNWLAQTGLCAPDNEAPQQTLVQMGEAEQLAAKMTIWYDVFASISQDQSPRFLASYRRLFGSIITREVDDRSLEAVSMDFFMGCPSDVLLVLAETAALAQWKKQERQLGTLSNRELLRRAVAIEERLLVSSIAETAERIFSASSSASVATTSQLHPTRPSGEHSVPPPATPASQPGQGGAVGTVTDTRGAAQSSIGSLTPSSVPLPLTTPSSPEPSSAGSGRKTPTREHSADVRKRVAQVFLHTASLYLASIINDPSPSIPELSKSVDAIIIALRNLSDVSVDRMLVLPITLAGCLTDQPEHRRFLRSRLGQLDEVIGNIRSVRLLMEHVWAIRDIQGGVVDWRDVMRNDLGAEILLV